MITLKMNSVCEKMCINFERNVGNCWGAALHDLACNVADKLGVGFVSPEVRIFPDTESKLRFGDLKDRFYNSAVNVSTDGIAISCKLL
jgi:hypothetical protein